MDLTFKHFRGDLFGGITAGIVALPLALAFGAQTELGAEAGLYGATFLCIFAALLGGTQTQISGPTGPMTVVSITVIIAAIELAGGKVNGEVPMMAIGVIIATFMFAGFLEFMMGILKLGKYIRFIPYPVVSGFMSGIGFIIIFLQIFDFFGYDGPDAPKKIFAIVMNVGLALKNTNIAAVSLALVTILIIYFFPKITKAVPSTLVALIGVSAAAYFLKLDVPIIGDIPSGLPIPDIAAITGIDFGDSTVLSFMLEYGFILAALGAIDSLLTSVVADNLTKTKHDSDKELRGQGLGNMISGLLGGLPGAGATMRTVVNINSGGKTRLSGIIAGILLLGIMLGASSFAKFIPMSVLAGILITVGIGIIDYRGLRHLRKIPLSDAVILIVVLVMTVFVDLLWAVAAGMVLASLLFMKKMSEVVEEKTKIAPIEEFGHELEWEDEKGLPQSVKDHVYIKHLSGPLFFGFASQFQQIIKAIPDVKFVVIRMKEVPYIDQSGLYALEEAILLFESKNIDVILTGIQKQPRDMLEGINTIPNLIEEKHIFETFTEAADFLIDTFEKEAV